MPTSRFKTAFLLLAFLGLFHATPTSAATRYWVGSAQDIYHIATLTVAGTWATGDTGTLTLNDKALIYTAGTAVTTSDIAAGLARMINGDAEANAESRTFTGGDIGEWAEVSATSSGAVLTLKSRAAGKAFGIVTQSEVTAGTGTLGAVSVTQQATGKNWITNVKNWDGGTLPIDDDTMVFASSNVSALYGLDGFTPDPTLLEIRGSYTGHIGLPAVNSDNPALPYNEYRARRLVVSNDTTFSVLIGDGSGSSTGRRYITCSTAASVVVNDTAPNYSNGAKPVELLLGAQSDVQLIRGHIDLTAQGTGSSTIGTLRLGARGGSDSFLSVVGAPTFTAGATYEQLSGAVQLNAATSNISAYQIRGGTLTLTSGNHAAIEMFGGTLVYNSSGTLGNLTIHSGATADFEQDPRNKTVAKVLLVRDATSKPVLKDQFGSMGIPTNGFDLLNATWSEVDYRGVKNYHWVNSQIGGYGY
jgi:hypothetical protein